MVLSLMFMVQWSEAGRHTNAARHVNSARRSLYHVQHWRNGGKSTLFAWQSQVPPHVDDVCTKKRSNMWSS